MRTYTYIFYNSSAVEKNVGRILLYARDFFSSSRFHRLYTRRRQYYYIVVVHAKNGIRTRPRPGLVLRSFYEIWHFVRGKKQFAMTGPVPGQKSGVGEI